MKTLEDLLGDRDARAAIDTLIARGCAPELVSEAIAYLTGHGVRRSSVGFCQGMTDYAAIVERDACDADCSHSPHARRA